MGYQGRGNSSRTEDSFGSAAEPLLIQMGKTRASVISQGMVDAVKHGGKEVNREVRVGITPPRLAIHRGYMSAELSDVKRKGLPKEKANDKAENKFSSPIKDHGQFTKQTAQRRSKGRNPGTGNTGVMKSAGRGRLYPYMKGKKEKNV